MPSRPVSSALIELRISSGVCMELTALLPSWKLALDAANRSPKTITSYLDSVKRLEAYLTDEELAGSKAAAAIDRYVRARARSNYAASPWLWLGTRGIDTDHFADSRIRFMLRRRGEQAGSRTAARTGSATPSQIHGSPWAAT